ncbi:IS630 family transposase domain protein [Rickettsiales endosymbiont of Paramecium tredecaurelia]|nr:IS630 family transposase domain protein [Candidatus Sarmatiella mevalonica]
MTKSYSNDLREKVVQYLEAGNSYDQASKLFKISVSAIGR